MIAASPHRSATLAAPAPRADHRLGRLEAVPNGDAVRYTDMLGVTPTIKETGRYTLRWPGWAAFWHPLKQLGFLDDNPVAGLPCEVSPIQFLEKLMGPRLQYRDNEKDLVVMLNIFEGLLGGKQQRLTSRLFDGHEQGRWLHSQYRGPDDRRG